MFTTQVNQFVLPLPPLEEQSVIVNVIKSSLDIKYGLEKTSVELAFAQLDQSILGNAFRGELVPQNPDDEPAAVLLERIRQHREAQAAAQNGKPNRRARRKKA